MSRTTDVIRDWIEGGDRLEQIWDNAIDSDEPTTVAIAELIESTANEIHRLATLMQNHIVVNFKVASRASDWLNGPAGAYSIPTRSYDLEAESRAIHSLAQTLSTQLTVLDNHVGRLESEKI